MINFRKFISMSAVAVLGVTNLLTPLSYASAASPLYDELTTAQLKESMLKFMMPDKDVYLKAIAEPNEYYVTYEGNGKTSGEMPTSGHFYYDTTGHLDANAYNKTGYTWTSWNTEENGEGTSHENGASVYNWTTENGVTIPIYAQWTANHYNITYSLNDAGGSSTGSLGTRAPTSGTYDQDVNIDHPSRQGYDFSGWNITNMNAETNLINGVASNATSVNNEESTLYKNLRTDDEVAVNFEATWTAKLTEYIVNHFTELLSGGYASEPTKTTTGSAPTDSTATGALETFPGFTAPDESSTTVTADGQATINYQYTRNSYDLNLNAGRGIVSVSAEGENTDPDLLNVSSATGSFKYQDPITLTFVLEDGYGTGTWSGYNDDASTFTMPLTAISKTAYAVPTEYTITYNYSGANVTPDNPASYNKETETFTLREPTRLHSDFAGWIGSNGSIPESVTIAKGSTGDRNYVATYTCHPGYLENDAKTECYADTNVEYHVRHWKQNLTGTYTSFEDELMYGTSDTYTEATGRNYDGFVAKTPINQRFLTGGITGINVDIQYERQSYSVTESETVGVSVEILGANDANAVEGKHLYDDTITITATPKNGYTFNSWTVTDASGTVTVVDANALSTTFRMPARDVTVKANVTEDVYTIEYNYNSGSATNPATYQVTTDTFTLNEPSRANSTFVGWSGGVVGETPTTQASVTIAKGTTGNRFYEAIWECDTGYTANGNTCVANTYTVSINYKDNGNAGTGDRIVTETFTYDDDTPTPIPNPTQSGYTFAGWTVSGLSGDEATDGIRTLTAPEDTGVTGTSFQNLTPTSGATVTLTANWIANTDTEYVVYHYTKNLEGDGYTLARTDSDLSGTTNATLTLSELTGTFVGFEYTGGYLDGTTSGPIGDKATTTVIKKDGTTEIHLYYTRKKHHVYLSGQNIANLTGEDDYDFEQEVTVTATPKTGYHFVEWKKKLDNTFTTDL